LKYINIAQSAVDMAVIDGQMMNFRRLCGVYKLPSVIFNDNASSTYNNLSEAYKKSYLDAIIPTFERLIDRFNYELLVDFGLNNHYLALDTTSIEVLQKDKKALSECMSKSEVFTKNEIRLALGYGIINDPLMDTVFISSSMKPIDMAMDDNSNDNDEDDNSL
jgi:phage portal protein BeeE